MRLAWFCCCCSNDGGVTVGVMIGEVIGEVTDLVDPGASERSLYCSNSSLAFCASSRSTRAQSSRNSLSCTSNAFFWVNVSTS